MASKFWSLVQNLWPFSLVKTDDLKVSNRLVRGLSIPEHTKKFVFAIREPDSQSVVYLLAVQNLSERSAADAELLIKELRPDAVVAGITPSAEENESRDDGSNSVPTSFLGVVKECFMNKIDKEKYESLAGSQVLHEIFGIGFHGHFLAAKKAAEEVDTPFLLLESPFLKSSGGGSIEEDEHFDRKCISSLSQTSGLLPVKTTSVISANSRRFCLSDNLQTRMVKSLSSSLSLSMSRPSSSDSIQDMEGGPGECQLRCNFQAPPYAQSVYSLLMDLHDIFNDLPAIGKALAYAQKILVDVDKGETVDSQLLSELYNFRIAVEGLRIALNEAARCPINKTNNIHLEKIEFSELPSEEKCHVLFAQALRNQSKKFKSLVAIVDASSLAGLRKHWNTPVPTEIAELADQCFSRCENDGETATGNVDKKKLLADKPVVAVGAGATAVLGVSSLSKVIPASTFMKLIPASLKFVLAQTQRTAAFALTKTLGPLKLVAPGIASSTAKTSAMKVTVSTGKIHAVTHSVIASAERTSFLAMRTAFYEIMRKRKSRLAGSMPWATFGCSVVTCTGLLVYGDGIERAAESVPAASTIACLGRGLRNLHQASQAVRKTDSSKIHETIQSLMYSLKKI